MKKCHFLVLVISLFVILFSFSCSQKKEQPPTNDITIKLKQHLPQIDRVLISDQNKINIAGHYSDFGPQMMKRLDGTLSGEDLFIFSDATYIYTRWADVLPQTIYEKGNWHIQENFLVLQSDGSLKNTEFPKDHKFIMVVINKTATPFLMGHSWDFSYFSEHVGKDPLFTFLLCSLEQMKKYYPEEEVAVKKDLLAKAWRPDLFGQ